MFFKNKNCFYLFFFLAAACDHYDIVAYLLQHNADPTLLDSDGETPYVCAVSEKTKLLIKNFVQEC